MESDTSSPAGLEKGGPFNPSTSDYFGTTFHGVGEIGVDQQYIPGDDAVSGGDFSLDHHHPQQSSTAIALFPYPEPSGPDAVAASTAVMHAPPVPDWQGGLSLYDTVLFSPSIEHVGQQPKLYSQPNYYGAWASGAQPMVGLGLISPHSVEEQSQQPQPQPQPQLQAQHDAWGQMMTPPEDSFPVAHEGGRPQMPGSLHFVPGFAQLPASNGISSGGPNMSVGGGGASAEMVGFQYSSAGVGDQLSPVTPIDFVDSPSTLVPSPQPGTPGRRQRRLSISASSPASLSTVSAPTRAGRASSTSPHEDSIRPKLPKKLIRGSASHPRGFSSGVGRESNNNGGKRPASTDDDKQGSGAARATAAGKSPSRARGSNREAAKKCREKTRLNEQHLEERERIVKTRNDRLKRELDLVKEEVQMWRSHLLMHGGCENLSINNWIKNRAAEISEKMLSPTSASQALSQAQATAPSRLQPLTPMPINGRLNFRLQPPPPPLTRRPAR
ncbi:hypothetical protein GGTG_11938 [Gaeumannomyces tritici R3-111a-1]|uniref:BZIP domain-containing protein n=1 Tax=Gaeumannomyces tritici (strain R3-111a-1) TaxID=644352 RepID=J3PEK7_GAET3|nr:hypothetical protein GGTG_11938 [Gaeumannomyces tritici R3-111a-1]EJT70915.1 hypothetical protein GGTG_11938 [Gaeumannomyces tritici R3-111a-1]